MGSILDVQGPGPRPGRASRQSFNVDSTPRCQLSKSPGAVVDAVWALSGGPSAGSIEPGQLASTSTCNWVASPVLAQLPLVNS